MTFWSTAKIEILQTFLNRQHGFELSPFLFALALVDQKLKRVTYYDFNTATPFLDRHFRDDESLPRHFDADTSPRGKTEIVTRSMKSEKRIGANENKLPIHVACRVLKFTPFRSGLKKRQLLTSRVRSYLRIYNLTIRRSVCQTRVFI